MSIEIRAQVCDTLRAQSLEQLQHPARIELPQRYRHVMEQVAIPLLAAAQCLLGLLARGDIHDRAGKLQVLRLVHQGMGDDMKMLDRSVRHLQPMLEIERLFMLCGPVDRLLH